MCQCFICSAGWLLSTCVPCRCHYEQKLVTHHVLGLLDTPWIALEFWRTYMHQVLKCVDCVCEWMYDSGSVWEGPQPHMLSQTTSSHNLSINAFPSQHLVPPEDVSVGFNDNWSVFIPCRYCHLCLQLCSQFVWTCLMICLLFSLATLTLCSSDIDIHNLTLITQTWRDRCFCLCAYFHVLMCHTLAFFHAVACFGFMFCILPIRCPQSPMQQDWCGPRPKNANSSQQFYHMHDFCIGMWNLRPETKLLHCKVVPHHLSMHDNDTTLMLIILWKHTLRDRIQRPHCCMQKCNNMHML